MGDVVILSDRLAKLAPAVTSRARGKVDLRSQGRIVLSSAAPQAIAIIRSIAPGESGRVLLLVESGRDAVLSPAMMESLARVRGIRTVCVDDEPKWASIVTAWLGEPSPADVRPVAPAATRRAGTVRKAAYRAA